MVLVVLLAAFVGPDSFAGRDKVAGRDSHVGLVMAAGLDKVVGLGKVAGHVNYFHFYVGKSLSGFSYFLSSLPL